MYCPLIGLGYRSQQKYSMFTTGILKGRKDNFIRCTFCCFCNWERESATLLSALSCLTNWRDILGLQVCITEIWQHLESWNPWGLLESSRVALPAASRLPSIYQGNRLVSGSPLDPPDPICHLDTPVRPHSVPSGAQVPSWVLSNHLTHDIMRYNQNMVVV